ncbi:MAG: hypothetical protein AAB472_01330 [Patescibacteria group bacterium]
MISLLRSLSYLLICVLGLFVWFGMYRTWQLERSPDQARFLAGTIPQAFPDGLYTGSVPGHKVSWLGKKFDAIHWSGINLFENGSSTPSEKYPFVTSEERGLRDTYTNVIVIDYDIEENPFWLRPIRDEIVEIGPGHFLGKLQVRLIPWYPFTLAFFELKK